MPTAAAPQSPARRNAGRKRTRGASQADASSGNCSNPRSSARADPACKAWQARRGGLRAWRIRPPARAARRRSRPARRPCPGGVGPNQVAVFGCLLEAAQDGETPAEMTPHVKHLATLHGGFKVAHDADLAQQKVVARTVTEIGKVRTTCLDGQEWSKAGGGASGGAAGQGGGAGREGGRGWGRGGVAGGARQPRQLHVLKQTAKQSMASSRCCRRPVTSVGVPRGGQRWQRPRRRRATRRL